MTEEDARKTGIRIQESVNNLKNKLSHDDWCEVTNEMSECIKSIWIMAGADIPKETAFFKDSQRASQNAAPPEN